MGRLSGDAPELFQTFRQQFNNLEGGDARVAQASATFALQRNNEGGAWTRASLLFAWVANHLIRILLAEGGDVPSVKIFTECKVPAWAWEAMHGANNLWTQLRRLVRVETLQA